VKYIASHSDAKYAIVNDQEQADKFLDIKDELPLIRKIVYWDPKGLCNYDDPLLISFSDVVELGKEYEKLIPVYSKKTWRRAKVRTPLIYYTSGTTGLPKGAITTHQALITTARGFVSRYPLTQKDNLISNFPPPGWESYFGLFRTCLQARS
jgi:long-chain acyl-CoA synthetase